MSVLLDTNILTRTAQPAHPHHAAAVGATTSLRAAGEKLCIVPQNLYEFYVFATRPITAANPGLGLNAAQAQALIAHFEGLFSLRADSATVYERWKALVTAHQTTGKPAHDARLVAAMDVHGIPRILTFNGGDFARYRHVTVIDPARAAPPPGPQPPAQP